MQNYSLIVMSIQRQLVHQYVVSKIRNADKDRNN